MAQSPFLLVAKCLRILVGLVLVGWGIVSFIIFILPGGLWTIFLGLVILAIDIPWVRRFNNQLQKKLQERFPRFYERAIIPLDRVKEKMMERVRIWREWLGRSIWPKYILGVYLTLLAGVLPASALEIEGGEKLLYQLDTKFIEEIWKEVITVTNAEALVLKVEETVKPPKIKYDPKQPQPKSKWAYPIVGTTEYWIDKKTGQVFMDHLRIIIIYPAAFERWVPDYHYTAGLVKLAGPFPEQAYGVIAQEFFHETLFHQYVSDDYHHCAMIFRGTLKKVLRFIDARLDTGERVTQSVLGYTQGQCEQDSGGRIRFPVQFPSR